MASSKSTHALHWARLFVADVSGKTTIVVPPEALPLYHAMTVFSSNFITLLFSAVEQISESFGQNPKRMKAALRALAEQALKNAIENPAKEVLTGPIARKDFGTIRKHQQALQKLDPRIKCIYDTFFSYALKSANNSKKV